MRAFWLAVFGGALIGCADEAPIDTPEATLEAADAIAAEATFMIAIMSGSDASPESEVEFIADVAANVPLRWAPSGCAQITMQPNTAAFTITFDDCSGPRGLVHVTGTLRIWWTGWPTHPVYGAHSPNVSANGSSFTVNGTVEPMIRPEGDGLYGYIDGTAIGPRGYELDRMGAYGVTWPRDSECSSISASTESDRNRMINDEPRWFTESKVTRCPGQCPSGFAIRRFTNDARLRVDMDGSPLATWASMVRTTTTRSGTLDLACE